VQPKIYTADDHNVRHNLVDSDALYVLEELEGAGFKAYLVGGGVRDLLCNRKPKDFDISTSATPEQIKHLFKRKCLLIGRRFRLAHIRFRNQKIIEVATFRAGDNHKTDELIVRDNIWGTPEEDVIRRDFTINALFYSHLDDSIIDYFGGYKDIYKGILRSIGDPEKRFKQDPVRMIRLLKFKARFGYDVEPKTLHALDSCLGEITKSSPVRVLEEMLRMQESGCSETFFRLMKDKGLLSILFPAIDTFIGEVNEAIIYDFLRSMDMFNKKTHGNMLERPVLVSGLFFSILASRIAGITNQGEKPLRIGEIIDIVDEFIFDSIVPSFPLFPRRILHTVHFILTSQYRMTPLSGEHSRNYRIMNQVDFPLALRFLKVRTMVDSSVNSHYVTWSDYWNTIRPAGRRSTRLRQSLQLRNNK